MSATTADLGECRRRVSDILMQAGIFPVVQDYFGPDPREIDGLLLDKILAADAVVCLVGHAFGTAAANRDDPIRRSYTQIEYDFASRYEKPLYVFVATDEYARAHPVDQEETLRANQEAHRKAILTGRRKYEQFSSSVELETHIRTLLQPILVDAGRRSIKWLHPPPRPVCFVGRTSEMQQFNASLDQRSPSLIVVLGMGGQGKTSLCAHTLRSRSILPFARGIWVSAESGFTFSEFLDAALAEFLGNRFHKADAPRLDARMRRLISLLQARPLLIGIDAVERWLKGWNEHQSLEGLHDMSLRQGASEGLDEFLQQVSALENGSHVILTSRALPAALDAVGCAIVPVFPEGGSELGLRGLPLEDSVRLLSELGMLAPPEKLRELANSLVGHPLALTGFAGVAGKVGAKWEALIPRGQLDPSRKFHTLLGKIREHLPDLQMSDRLLTFCSLIPEGVTVEMLGWMTRPQPGGTPEPDDALLARVLMLRDWNLLLWDPQTGTARLHGLIAAYFAGLISDAGKREIHRCAAGWYEQCAEKCEASNRGPYEVLGVRHSLRAGDSEKARAILFGDRHPDSALFDWLVFHGHLWECAELLTGLEEISSEMDQIPLVLARVHILHRLELSHRALADVERVTACILAQSGPAQFRLQPALAQCYGIQGLIHTEAGKASEALPFLDKAIALFESFAAFASDAQWDLARTQANRGLARWSCGNWDGAEADYRTTLNLLSSLGRQGAKDPDVEAMGQEVRARLGALHLDRGNPAEAARALEPVVLELRAAQQKSRARPHKNEWMASLYLGAAYVAGERPQKALDVLREVILPLEELNQQGRSDFNAVLAQARVNEAQALLRLGKTESAAHASERSVCLYETLMAKGATQFQGQLSNALFKRAEARIRLGAGTECREDLRRALALATDWIAAWFGECNFQSVFIGNAVQILPLLTRGLDREKREMLEMIKQCLARNAAVPNPSEASLRENEILAEKWPILKAAALEIGVQWEETPVSNNASAGKM